MIGTASPLLLFPGQMFGGAGPALTLEAQYIIKNLVLVSGALVIGGAIRAQSTARWVQLHDRPSSRCEQATERIESELKMARDIAEVIRELDRIIEDAHERRSRIGFFAALYRKVTVAVQEGIRDGFFDDGPRMERLDVVFANRYLDALRRHTAGETTTESWRVAFEAAESPRLIILQHLFLGINAHINLDLGIAAADVAPAGQIDGLEGDFNRINTILADLVDDVQEAIATVSPWLGLLDRLGGRADEDFAEFSLEAARDHAWALARSLATADPAERDRQITVTDQTVAGLAGLVVDSGPIVRLVTWLVRLRESRDVPKVLRALE